MTPAQQALKALEAAKGELHGIQHSGYVTRAESHINAAIATLRASIDAPGEPTAWQRRQGVRCGDAFDWGEWQGCIRAEAERVTGLRSWQVRPLFAASPAAMPAQPAKQGEADLDAPIRSVTASEDKWLRDAVKRGSTVIPSGKLAAKQGEAVGVASLSAVRMLTDEELKSIRPYYDESYYPPQPEAIQRKFIEVNGLSLAAAPASPQPTEVKP